MQSAPKRLLVVDDEPDILEFLQVILEDEGYTVVTSDKGEYLEQLHNGGLPHLILVDVLLSGKDGLFDKVRGRLAGGTIPFIRKYTTIWP